MDYKIATDMGLLDLFIHVFNFAAPALVVAVLLTAFTPIFMKKVATIGSYKQKLAINLIACIVTLLLGLWLFGRDGKMPTYVAMVLASATCQWILLRGYAAKG